MVATTIPRLEFIDAYWIIPVGTTKPYNKVSFTHQVRHISADSSIDFIKNPSPFRRTSPVVIMH